MPRAPYYIAPLLVVLLFGCSKSDEQREFENRATQNEPRNITETDANGNQNGNVDPDDWQISPNYEGLVSFGTPEPQVPYPNPVDLNTNLTIQLDLNVPDALQRIEIYSYHVTGNPIPVTTLEQSELSTFNTISINSNNIAAGEGTEASTTYRLLIYDGQENLVSYGDVRIR